MAFESLTERLQGAFKKLRGKGKVSEADVREMTKEIRLALLEADVALPVVKDFVKNIRERAVGVEVLEKLNPAQQIVKIVDEELTKTLGSTESQLLKSPKIPTVIMMTGLQGAGKTTFAGKLANRLIKEENARPLMIAADIYRPAAIDQLKVLGSQINVPVFEMGTEVSPVEIVRQGLIQAAEQHNDYVLIDTAGRLHIDEHLMQELADIKSLANPTEILLVVDAMTGQDAVNVAQAFDEKLGITGVIITKLDGDTRGGAALSIRAITGKPIKFTGTGEKLTDLEVFYPDRMSSRILGMGDLLTLIEKAQQDFDEKKAAEMTQKMRENTFDFNDFIDQLDQVTNMGPIEDLLKMIPGMNEVPGIANVKVDPKDISRKRAIVMSMTPEERENPDVLSPSRRRRIAAGSGNTVIEVNQMIKQFNESKKMMRMVSNGNMDQMMQGIPGMDQMMGGGVKGKLGKMAMNRMMKQANKKMKKKKKKR
ncbi:MULTISPECIES: signal recognition particle protein [unclassified Enterococcus]|uniref:signal recognition particle protein n=1 Tax=unclassified Enterococcus TaxID=2608891 RepID=UPI001553D856|nr:MULTISPECIES: signal recognition particle protein [unclassified Enterococcus]MBS7576355.1 signal recognition particle protein [Enterococcus sp. MMGLQ5-2]MBS7583587.1 signal recognition particle protein [Enterococcus sp. MMGLQ5-1]NPD11449.1 signal recognition particle protein [Enterococcus sp. MMGLQ5-1]NPD36193.1 signal recognition particle protein [Enterococcus sp. MMGLQ5-2]